MSNFMIKVNLDIDVSLQIRQDIDYLKANNNDHFVNTPLAIAAEILGRKNTYKVLKQEQHELYTEYKVLIKQMREAKLPYRFVDLMKRSLEKGNRLPYPLNNKYYREYDILKSPSTKEERRPLFNVFEKKIVDQAVKVERASSLAERTYWMHGTNSALLPLLRYTANTLLPAGVLLSQGLAPMCGELIAGGMDPRIGVNQRAVSVDTIYGMERCWSYATSGSRTSHFKENSYKDREAFFLSEINQLFDVSYLETASWDMPLVHLLRFKQWHPEEFVRLCTLHSVKIAAMKNEISSPAFPLESKVLKLAAFTKDQLEQYAKGSSEERQKFEDEYSLGNKWDEEDSHFESDPIGKFLSQFIERGSLTPNSNEVLVKLILFGQKHLDTLKEKVGGGPVEFPANDAPTEIINSFLERYQMRKTWEQLIAKCGENPDLESVMEQFVRKRIEALINEKNNIVKLRLDRLEKLFDLEPQVHLSENDRQLILQPFPILFASTKARAEKYSNEFHMKEAQLGSVIDQVYVPEKNLEQMQRFLSENALDQKVEVFDQKILEEMLDLPKIAASYQA